MKDLEAIRTQTYTYGRGRDREAGREAGNLNDCLDCLSF